MSTETAGVREVPLRAWLEAIELCEELRELPRDLGDRPCPLCGAGAGLSHDAECLTSRAAALVATLEEEPAGLDLSLTQLVAAESAGMDPAELRAAVAHVAHVSTADLAAILAARLVEAGRMDARAVVALLSPLLSPTLPAPAGAAE